MLEGDLTDFTLPDILRLLALTGKSGRLTLHSGARHGRVDLLEGRVRDATADAATLGFARRLLGAGVVDGPGLDEVLAGSPHLPTSLELARELVALDRLDAAAVAELLREQSVDAVFDLLRWREGRFRFAVAGDEDRGPSVLDLALAVEDLLEEAGRRLDAWPGLAERTGALDGAVSICRPGRDRAEVALPPDGWTLLSLVDGRRTLGDLVRLSGQGEYRTRRSLGALIDEGVIAVAAAAGPGPVERLLADHDRLAAREAALPGADAAVPAARPSSTEERQPAATDRKPAVESVNVRPVGPEVASDDVPAVPSPAPEAAAPTVRQLRARVRPDPLRTDPTVDEHLVTRLIEGVEAL